MIKMRTDFLEVEGIKMLNEIAKGMLQEKYNLKNDLIMTGWAFKINSTLENIVDNATKNKLEKECNEIWDKWYKKVHEEQLTEENLKTLNNLILQN